MDYEEDTYTTIFNALKHPIRRKILHMLDDRPSTYTTILTELGVETGFLNYHLDSLDGLIRKDNKNYCLSEIGAAAIGLTTRVEHKVKQESASLILFGRKYYLHQILLPITLILLVLTGSSYYAFASIQSERTSNLEYELTLCRVSMNTCVELINETIINELVDVGDMDSLQKATEEIDTRLDAVIFLDQDRYEAWMQIKTVVNKLNSLSKTLEGSCRSRNQLSMEITTIQSSRLSSMMKNMVNLNNIAFPSSDQTGDNGIDVSLEAVTENVAQLENSIESTRQAFNLPQYLEVEE